MPLVLCFFIIDLKSILCYYCLIVNNRNHRSHHTSLFSYLMFFAFSLEFLFIEMAVVDYLKVGLQGHWMIF